MMAIGAVIGLFFGAIGICAAIALLAAIGGLGLMTSYSAGGFVASAVDLILATFR
jgi:hypothetical protein